MGRPDPTIAIYRQRLRDGVAGKHFNKSCVSHLDIRWSRAGHNAKIDALANGVIAGNRTLLSSALHSIAGIGEMNEAHISDRERKANFDLVCYQICLRTIHDLFEA